MTNPLKLIALYRKASAVLDALEDGKRDWERREHDDTVLYRSPAWWARVGTAIRDLALALPLPDEMRGLLTMRSWKTTLAGLSAILAVVVKVAQTGAIDWQTDAPAVLAGIGLIAAKDSNVTGAR